MDKHLQNGIQKLQETMARFNLRLDQIVPAVRHLIALDNKMTRDEIRAMSREAILDWWEEKTADPEDEYNPLEDEIRQEAAFSDTYDADDTSIEEDDDGISQEEEEEVESSLGVEDESSEEVLESPFDLVGVQEEASEKSEEEIPSPAEPAVAEEPKPTKEEPKPTKEEPKLESKAPEDTTGATVGMIYRSMGDYEKVVQERENQKGKLSSGVHRLQQTMDSYGLSPDKVIPQIRHLMEMDPTVPLGKIQHMDPRQVLRWWHYQLAQMALPGGRKNRTGLYDYTAEYEKFLEGKKQVLEGKKQFRHQQVINYQRRNSGMMVPMPPKQSVLHQENEVLIEQNPRRSREQKMRYLRERQAPHRNEGSAPAETLPVAETSTYSQVYDDPKPTKEQHQNMHEAHLSELRDSREMFEDGIFNDEEYHNEKQHILMSLRQYSDPKSWKTELRMLNHWKKEELISEDEFQQEKMFILKARQR